MSLSLDAFIQRWSSSSAAERANKDSFLAELCDVLGVPRPDPTTGDPERDRYVFERDVKLVHEGQTVTVGHIDLYKDGCFILEAKQGSDKGSAKLGTAKRGTPGWNIAMRDAFGQALGYARGFDRPPPFIVVCDLGHCFDLYAAFDGTLDYRPFPDALASRLYLTDLARHADVLRAVFTDPLGLDPARHSVRVTREVAAHLAELARSLEAEGHAPGSIATFLMRCLFTMFAEDVGLLPERTFTDLVEKFWLPHPAGFAAGVTSLWEAMNDGKALMTGQKLLRFNGGLFRDPAALPLRKEHLQLLLEAAKCDWADVEPAIFGTLIERALDPEERHALGAHFTPKAYVERLVKPTIEEPLRSDWELVRAEVRHLVEQDKVEEAKKSVRAFHRKLCSLRVLDPACGSGNFLYVTLDLFKRLEGEVIALLADLGDTQTSLELQTVTVNPSQFLGIEIKRWSKEIAELVLWIGYLQWHVRTFRRGEKTVQVPEPVLQDYHNIECRDAVLAYDRQELLRDADGKPVTRWGGRTKPHPVTGEEVPDESDQKPVYAYVNPRKAEWPRADFIVGNPPFLGKLHFISAFGEGYAESLRSVYADEVPDSADLVMYWWHRAAQLAASSQVRRFGFVTTNSIHQVFNRRIVSNALGADPPIHLKFAIPDHPWVDTEEGAAVRIAMTVGASGTGSGVLSAVVEETPQDDGVAAVSLITRTGTISADLRVGVDLTTAQPLAANRALASMGPATGSRGFVVTPEEREHLLGRNRREAELLIRPLRNGRDYVTRPRGVFAIDLHGMHLDDVRRGFPEIHQHLLDRVLVERAQNNDPKLRSGWWLFRRSNEAWRAMLKGLSRFIVTVETAKHRVFFFEQGGVISEHGTISFGLDDPLVLGLLSSRLHVVWSLATGGRLGVGNDPRYNKTRCFEPFPFPVCTEEQKQRIRELGDSLDAHRKRQQAAHPDLTITGMYNVLEKLRSGEALTVKEKVIHEQGLVSVLKKLHDDLDAAVFDAYGWPHDLTDEQILERLVALNAERAEEEKRGLIRWLRPDFQCPAGAPTPSAELDLPETEPEPEPEVVPAKPKRGRKASPAPSGDKPRWPDVLPEQIAAVRDLVSGTTTAWTAEAVARSFKYARATSVELVLDSLTALGLLVSYPGDGGKTWRAG